jgi:hypothetical protein
MKERFKRALTALLFSKKAASLLSVLFLAGAVVSGSITTADAKVSTGMTGTTVNPNITSYSSGVTSEVLDPYLILTPTSGIDLSSVYKKTSNEDFSEYSRHIAQSGSSYVLQSNNPNYEINTGLNLYGFRVQYWAQSTQMLLQNPSQDASSILFVPYSIWKGTTLTPASDGSHWKYNVTSILYNEDGLNQGSAKLTSYSSSTYKKSIVFCSNVSQSDVSTYQTNGVFYSTLAKYYKNGTLDYDALRSALSSQSKIDALVKGKTSESKKVWSYIMSITKGSTYSTSADDRFAEFLVTGYNNSVSDLVKTWGVDYGDVKLDSKASNASIANAYKTEVRTLDDYMLHYIDLMLCAYGCIYENGFSAQKANWVQSIKDAATVMTSKSTDTTVPAMAVSLGIIAKGDNKDKNGKTTNLVVYANVNDLVALDYNLTVVNGENGESATASQIAHSVTKTYIGTPVLRATSTVKLSNGEIAQGELTLISPSVYGKLNVSYQYLVNIKNAEVTASSSTKFSRELSYNGILPEKKPFYNGFILSKCSLRTSLFHLKNLLISITAASNIHNT